MWPHRFLQWPPPPRWPHRFCSGRLRPGGRTGEGGSSRGGGLWRSTGAGAERDHQGCSQAGHAGPQPPEKPSECRPRVATGGLPVGHEHWWQGLPRVWACPSGLFTDRRFPSGRYPSGFALLVSPRGRCSPCLLRGLRGSGPLGSPGPWAALIPAAGGLRGCLGQLEGGRCRGYNRTVCKSENEVGDDPCTWDREHSLPCGRANSPC